MRTNPVPTDPTQAYTLAVYDEVLRIAGAARHGRDVLDIANNVAVTVLESSASIMQRFPRPEEYARACARNAGATTRVTTIVVAARMSLPARVTF